MFFLLRSFLVKHINVTSVRMGVFPLSTAQRGLFEVIVT